MDQVCDNVNEMNVIQQWAMFLIGTKNECSSVMDQVSGNPTDMNVVQ